MIDAHCHIDAYPDPMQTALDLERAGILTIAVTESPSAFEQAYPRVRGLKSIRLAVGLHPLLGQAHARERALFARSFTRTSYVGEVGLDYSDEGRPAQGLQVESFRHVLGLVRTTPKVVSVHSRRAEAAVLDLLEECGVAPVVFHWYSGSVSHLDRLLRLGHFCSVNPAMVRSAKGRIILERLPPERILTETDGPYISVQGRPILPGEVGDALAFFATAWNMTTEGVERRVWNNLRSHIALALKKTGAPGNR